MTVYQRWWVWGANGQTVDNKELPKPYSEEFETEKDDIVTLVDIEVEMKLERQEDEALNVGCSRIPGKTASLPSMGFIYIFPYLYQDNMIFSSNQKPTLLRCFS